MLVLYKGYGYWETFTDELISGVAREGEIYMDSCIFELPKDAEKEITYLGKAIVSYLFPSKDPDIKWPMYICNDSSRFVLCNDEPKCNEKGYQIDREEKTVTYTRDQIIPELKTEQANKFKVKLENVKEQTNSKQRKKLIPHLRDNNNGLLLVYEIFTKYNVEYLDDLPASKAWGKVVSREFTSELIESISDAKQSITLKDGEKLSKEDFSDKYRRRFK